VASASGRAVAEREVLVVGAGIGGLAAALALAARGLAVRVLEAGPRPGGKAGTVELDGIRVETGPSVLTLPGVFADVFARAGLRLADVIGLRRLDPGFRYRYADGCVLDVAHAPEQTLANVRSALGPAAAGELADFLAYSRRIWEAAAPHFVLGPAPTWTAMAGLALRHPRALAAVDPLRSMAAGIDRQVRDPHLRMLLRRYATYNGSDPRHAPATLNCIAHIELSLGGYGIEGGVFALVEALVAAIETSGGVIECGAEVDRVLLDGGVAAGVVLAGGAVRHGRAVVINADVEWLRNSLEARTARQLPGPAIDLAPRHLGWHRHHLQYGQTPRGDLKGLSGCFDFTNRVTHCRLDQGHGAAHQARIARHKATLGEFRRNAPCPGDDFGANAAGVTGGDGDGTGQVRQLHGAKGGIRPGCRSR
jgi:phytoene desaturase